MATDSAAERIVFPLDVSDSETAANWLVRLRGHVGVFKVGLELYTSMGPMAVDAVHRMDAACFLDLKLHDIPATMAGAVRSATRLGVRYLTVHASAGPAALEAAAEAAEGTSTKLLAVTVLTSLDDASLEALGHRHGTEATVPRLARLAYEAGVRGFVCSPREVATLREELGPDVCLVVPGVRPAGSETGDQRRTATPAEAVRSGANLLVIGRPIRLAADPIAAADGITAEIAAELGS